MKSLSTKNIEQFLKEIESLKAKVSVLEQYETDISTPKNNIIPSNLASFTWLENSPVCTKIIDVDFNLQYMSKSGVAKLKIDDINKFYGKPYPLNFYSDSFKIPMKDGLIEAKASGKPITQEASILDADGNEIWFNSTLIPINDTDGNLDYFLIVSSDITARKQAQIDLIESEEKLKQALQITGLGTFMFDDSTNLFETSPISDIILGIDNSYKRDIQGWENLVHPEDFENAQLLLDNTNTASVSSEFRIIRPKDKKTIWLLGHAKLEFNTNGIRTKITGTIQDISSRKEAEKTIRENQDFNESLLKTSPNIIYVHDLNKKRNVYNNNGGVKILGYSKQELIDFGDRFISLYMHPDDYKTYTNKTIERYGIMKDGEVIDLEYRIRYKNGNYRWLHSRETIFKRSENGEPSQIFGIAGDITERKEAEKIIRDSQDFNESLLKTSPDIIYVYDIIEQKNVYSNEGNLKVLGYTPKEIENYGENLISNLMHPTDYKFYLDNIIPKYQHAKDGQIIEYENRLKHKNGSWCWLHSKETIFKRTQDGTPSQIFGIAGNITERKIAEEKLRASQANLKSTFDISPSIISTVNLTTGYFMNVSPAVTRILGFTPEELISRPFIEFIHPDDRPRTTDKVVEKKENKIFTAFENRYLCKDGGYKWIAWQGTAPNENGIVTAIGSDIDLKKQNEEKLKLSAERFERWKSSNFIGILQSNTKGDIIDANDTILDMLGYTKAELLDGKLNWAKLTPPEFLSQDAKAIKEAEEKGFWTPFEKEYYHKDGHRIPIIIGGTLFKETQNEFIVFVINLTESKETEKDLKESEEFLNLTGEVAKVGGWELNLASNMVKWSKETKSIHEVSLDYQPCLDTAISFYHPEDQERVKKLVSDAIENGNLYSYEARIITAKGNQKFVKATGQPVFKDGKCVRLYGAFQDITERKKVDEELENYRKQLETENVLLKKEFSLSFSYEDIVYASDEISNVLTQVEQVASTDATVLILGETGTGKELIAKAIHNTSNRKNNSLIRVNCGAIPSELIESELFGHVKGSFTGAINNRIGKFELADGGTIFLDEIGELPLNLQPKLLRAIQEGEIEPIGSSELRKLDVRIIAATNKNLKQEVLEKHFREDLYFRLNVFPIDIPPLRKRIEDIAVLTDYFVNKYTKKHGKHIKYISDGTIQQMKSYNWPGNVRELENLIERAVIISNQDVLVMQEFENTSPNKTNIKNHNKTLNEVQRDYILKILNETQWKIDGKKGAAVLLDIKPSTLRDRMKKLHIKRQ